MNAHPLWLGTCAWDFQEWRHRFYPADLPSGEWLEFYARYFNCAEVDSTFYHLPGPDLIHSWEQAVPDTFSFCCRFPRWITHELRLRDAGESVSHFLHAVDGLGSKLGILLIELPPAFRPSHDALALRKFIRELPSGYRFVIEFGSSDWHTSGTTDLLARHNIAWSWSDIRSLAHQNESPFDFYPETADFLYVRLLGDLKTRFTADGRLRHEYGNILWSRRAVLKTWATRLQRHLGRQEVFVFADNHYEGFAPATCMRLAEHLSREQPLPHPPSHATPEDPGDEQLSLF